MATSVERLIGEPLYQVNLLLWMLQASTGAPVEPVLQQAGYKLRWVEIDLPLPLALGQRLRTEEIEFSDPVAPDVVIEGAPGEYVLVECKRTMFGATPQEGGSNSAIRQATSLLLQVPGVLNTAVPVPPESVRESQLVYLSRRQDGLDQLGGVSEIAVRLRAVGFQTVRHSLLTLTSTPDAVFLHGCDQLPLFPRDLTALKVQDVQPDTDPRPLYLLPWLPSSEPAVDEYNQRAFGARILSEAAIRVGLQTPPTHVVFDVDELLRSVMRGVYDRWRNKADRNVLRSNARKLIKTQLGRAKYDLLIDALPTPSSGWRVGIPEEKAKQEILEAFRASLEKWNEKPEPELFPDDAR